MKRLVYISIIIIFPICAMAQDAPVFPGASGTWYGYQKYSFQFIESVEGRDLPTDVYAPTQPAEGNPWVLRAKWWGYNSELDRELLARGYHVVYMDLEAHDYGDAKPLRFWSELYDDMTQNYGLAQKAILIGGSRGGLQVFNWARENTDKVQSIFTNVGVCDFMSWPGSENPIWNPTTEEWVENEFWRNLKYGYGFCTSAEYAADITAGDAEAEAWEHNIVDDYMPLVEAEIPIFCVAGDSDETVPLTDNGQLLYDRLTAAGGDMRLEIVEGGTHSTTWDGYYASVGGDLTETADFLTAPSYAPEPATIFLIGISAGCVMLRRKSC